MDQSELKMLTEEHYLTNYLQESKPPSECYFNTTLIQKPNVPQQSKYH